MEPRHNWSALDLVAISNYPHKKGVISMTENNITSQAMVNPAELTSAVDSVQQTMSQFLDTANVSVVYGKPVKNGETQIIPSAEVLTVMGFGAGYGSGTNVENGEQNGGSGGGGGGGGRVLSRPVAVVIASPSGVTIEPVVDVTKIALAALTAAGFMMGMLFKMARGPRLGD
jgi:uncharacterized spore protein YtfJ